MGRLWAAVEPVYYLVRSRPNLVAWFTETRQAQMLFDAGDFDALVQLELDRTVRTFEAAPAQAPYTHLQDAAAVN